VLGGRKVTVTRPRARHRGGSGEVELATYKHFNTEDLLGEMALERMVAGCRPGTTPPASNRSATPRRFESMISIGARQCETSSAGATER
jgi:hypothetical protein